jgi:hypothetical protein
MGSGRVSWGRISARVSSNEAGGLAAWTEGKVKDVSIVGREGREGEEADKPAE